MISRCDATSNRYSTSLPLRWPVTASSAVVGRERALRIEQAQLLEIRIERAADETRLPLAGLGVAEPEVDEHLPRGQRCRLTGTRSSCRRSTAPARGRSRRRSSLRVSSGCANFRGRSMPPTAGSSRVCTSSRQSSPKLLERHAELAPERALDADARHGVHDSARSPRRPTAGRRTSRANARSDTGSTCRARSSAA